MIILTLTVVCCTHPVHAQQLDSLINLRETELHTYTQFKDTMQERTWLNLVELGNKAAAVIERDNQLIEAIAGADNHLIDALQQEKQEKILEINYLSQQEEKLERRLIKYQQMNTILLIVIAGLFILGVILFTLLIIRTNQYKYNQIELERFWSMQDEYSIAHQEKESELLRQIRLLEIEQKAMQKEFILLSDQRTEAHEKLKKEISNRRKVEEEIKELLGQLKTK
jgi:hypothetical protein